MHEHLCDRCGFQAYVLLSKGKQTLKFCGHHYTYHANVLGAQGFVVELDERHLINEKPSVSV